MKAAYIGIQGCICLARTTRIVRPHAQPTAALPCPLLPLPCLPMTASLYARSSARRIRLAALPSTRCAVLEPGPAADAEPAPASAAPACLLGHASCREGPAAPSCCRPRCCCSPGCCRCCCDAPFCCSCGRCWAAGRCGRAGICSMKSSSMRSCGSSAGGGAPQLACLFGFKVDLIATELATQTCSTWRTGWPCSLPPPARAAGRQTLWQAAPDRQHARHADALPGKAQLLGRRCLRIDCPELPCKRATGPPAAAAAPPQHPPHTLSPAHSTLVHPPLCTSTGPQWLLTSKPCPLTKVGTARRAG